MKLLQIAAITAGLALATGCIVEEDRGHVPPGQAKKQTAGGDHDRGHGNDPDGVDEDNPGRGPK